MSAAPAEPVLRPLRPDDDAEVDALRVLAHDALDGVGRALDARPDHWPDDEATRERTRRRIRACATTTPEASWVAEAADGELLGLGQLVVREGAVAFLSLLAVREGTQSAGLGRRLLAAASAPAAGLPAYLCATRDPRALRLYHREGFRLQPALGAHGPLDRSVLPGDLGVREGDPSPGSDDRARLQEAVRRQRGAGYAEAAGGELDLALGPGAVLLLAEDGPRRGAAVARAGSPFAVAADDEALAARLLWAALATAGPEDEPRVGWLTGRQQWALDVAVAARLPLGAGGAVAVRGEPGPMAPYLPNGAFG